MADITSRGRRGSVVVPNFRWEDPDLDPFELRIAGWLASHADSYLEKVTRNLIAKAAGISQGKVTLALDTLSRLGIIAVENVATEQSKGGHRLRITFDWEAWETPPVRSPRDRALVTTRPGPGHVVTSTKGSQEEDQEDSRSAELTASADAGFDEFWARYPRKVGKPAALRSWKTATKGPRENRERVLGGLVSWTLAWEAAGTETQFIPHATTWLNQRRWEDEPGVGSQPKPPEADPMADTVRKHLALSGIDVESRMDERERADFDTRLTKAITAVGRMGYDDGEILLRAALVAKNDWTQLTDPIAYVRRNEVDRFRGMPRPQIEGEDILDAMRRTRNLGRWVAR